MCLTGNMQEHHHHPDSPKVTAVEDWRKEAIDGGSLKHVDLHTGSNGWASPPGDFFFVRGPDYLNKKVKIPSGDWLMNPSGVDWLRSNAKLNHVLSRRDNRVMNALQRSIDCGEKSSKTFIVAVNLQVPGREHYSAVFYFSTKIDEPMDFNSSSHSNSLLYQFVNGSDAYRNSRFKLVNKIVNGPWAVKTAVGSHSACLLGQALKCYYHRGPNYLEIDVDIGCSTIAKAIVKVALGYSSAVTVDMGFLVEGKTKEELPEKLFGAVRICQMEVSSATFIDADNITPTSKVLPVSSSSESENEGDHLPLE